MPRCPSCGGETTWRGPGLGFKINGTGTPYIRFRCVDDHLGTPCLGTRTIRCDKEWRLLRPLGKFDEVYWELLHIQQNKENLFGILRDRFDLAGDQRASCPRRPGLNVQRLMGAMAMLVDWFRFAIKQGILASQHAAPGEVVERHRVGERRVRRVEQARRIKALALPYGQAAVRAGLASAANGPPPDPNAIPF